MKPLVDTKVKRGELLRDWIPAADQATDAGRADFWKRQQARMKQEQANRAEADDKVRDLHKVRA